MTPLDDLAALEGSDGFISRHVAPSESEIAAMLERVGVASLDALSTRTVPAAIRDLEALDLPPPVDEASVIAELRGLALRNTPIKSLIGQGYYGTHTPPVIRRNVLENPGWYTAYTPYQAEIAQGRLEALLNYQTMVAGLTGLPIANASLLDEATAAAEAVTMALQCQPVANRARSAWRTTCTRRRAPCWRRGRRRSGSSWWTSRRATHGGGNRGGGTVCRGAAISGHRRARLRDSSARDRGGARGPGRWRSCARTSCRSCC